MSERELNRIEVLSRVEDGTPTATRAGHLLNLSRRQIQRLVKRLRAESAEGIRGALRRSADLLHSLSSGLRVALSSIGIRRL